METTMDGASAEMPRYRSHKTVHALRIREISEARSADGAAIITPDDPGYAPFEVSGEYMRKHEPKAGGYYVVYDDGYKSWSPAEAFQGGYTRL
jgi:hypothetical protein